jgi:hypothetical protein
VEACQSTKYTWTSIKEQHKLSPIVDQIIVVAMPGMPHGKNYELGNLNLLGCHGVTNRMSNGYTVIISQEELHAEELDGVSARIPASQDTLCSFNHSCIDLNNFITMAYGWTPRQEVPKKIS